MKTIFSALLFLMITSCSRVNEGINLQIQSLETSIRSASALSEMRIMVLSSHLGAKTWMTEKFESVDKAMFKSTLKGREYFEKKEKLRSESQNWPIERKEKLKKILTLCDTVFSSYEELTTILKNFEDYDNPKQYFQARSIYDDNEIIGKNAKILTGLTELQNQFAMDIENSIAELKQIAK